MSMDAECPILPTGSIYFGSPTGSLSWCYQPVGYQCSIALQPCTMLYFPMFQKASHKTPQGSQRSQAAAEQFTDQ